MDQNQIYLLAAAAALLILCLVIFFWRRPKIAKSAEVLLPTSEVADTTAPELKKSFQASRNQIWGRLSDVLQRKNQQAFDDFEEILITSDISARTTEKLLSGLRKSSSVPEIRTSLQNSMQEFFDETPQTPLQYQPAGRPTVWMIVGINGAGKTTTIGKLAALHAGQGKKVLIAAGDTFRAAAGAQLAVWSERAQVEIFSLEGVKDPSAVAFDALKKAQAQNFDLVLIDTAGRLHNQSHLMDELAKMKRVLTKALDTAPDEVILVLDGNSGQNAFLQAKEFQKHLAVTGIILTKMEGTARGGVVISIADELKIPVRFLGLGEKLNDLVSFNSKDFLDSLFSD